jgi:hypothetical protein
VAGQPAAQTVRLALLSQWVIEQHRARDGTFVPAFQSALDAGVVDRLVFRWHHGVIPRQALVAKPIRVLTAAEAEALGARGDFQLVGVRPPGGLSAWTAVDVAARSTRPDDVLILEVGGELNSVSQVLESLAVVVPGRGLKRLPLVRRALVPGDGVQVVSRPFGRPVTLTGGVGFRGISGIEFVVIRSQVEAIENGGRTASGPADISSVRDAHGDWREGDRVLIRIPATSLEASAPPTVLAWKDRIFREGGPDLDILRGRAGLPLPIVR